MSKHKDWCILVVWFCDCMIGLDSGDLSGNHLTECKLQKFQATIGIGVGVGVGVVVLAIVLYGLRSLSLLRSRLLSLLHSFCGTRRDKIILGLFQVIDVAYKTGTRHIFQFCSNYDYHCTKH